MKAFIKLYPLSKNLFPFTGSFANLKLCEMSLFDDTKNKLLSIDKDLELFVINQDENKEICVNENCILNSSLDLNFWKNVFSSTEKIIFIDLISFFNADELKSLFNKKKSTILVKKGQKNQYLNEIYNNTFYLGAKVFLKEDFFSFSNLVEPFSFKNTSFEFLEAQDSIPISYPWHYLEANIKKLNELIRENPSGKINGEIEDNVVIKNCVFLGENSTIKSHSYIEGPVYIGKNCNIGPFAHLRPDTIIEKNCKIGKMEIVDSLIRNSTVGKHMGYVGHSIIDENVNIGANLITADYRYDGQDHITWINNKKVASYRRKLGTFIGKNVKTSINTLIYPGRKIVSNSYTLPSEVIIRDKN